MKAIVSRFTRRKYGKGKKGSLSKRLNKKKGSEERIGTLSQDEERIGRKDRNFRFFSASFPLLPILPLISFLIQKNGSEQLPLDSLFIFSPPTANEDCGT